MAFSDDNGGFAFSSIDSKMCFNASTWNTRLSQIGRMDGAVMIMTALLPDVEYIAKIIGKRPRDIYIIANVSAQREALEIKKRFPLVRIVLHKNTNAKVVLVAPETVWISSSDFGSTKQIEATVGFHSKDAFEKTAASLFNKVWSESFEVQPF
jgi:hypothetical protein